MTGRGSPAVDLLALALAAFLLGEGCGPQPIAPARLLGMDPDGRTVSAETPVRILGRGFLPVLELSPAGHAELQAGFSARLVGPSGEVPLERLRYRSSQELEAVVPRADAGGVAPLLPGSYRLELRTPQGELLRRERAFEVRLAPEIHLVRPSRRSPPEGGGPLELLGKHFVPGTVAWLGEQPILEQVIVSSERLTGKVPPAEPGVVDIRVVSPYGEDVLPDAFTYHAPGPLPTVLGVVPASGPAGGGTAVRVAGQAFDAATTVTFAGRPLLEQRFAIDEQGPAITGRTPPGEPGPVTVAARNALGAGPGLEGAFVYEPSAVPLRIDPAAGPQRGGTPVVLQGTGFGPTMRVLLGGAELLDLQVHDDQTATGTTPPGRGPVAVTVVSGGEQRSLADGFRYLPPPAVGPLIPAAGPALGPGDPAGEVELAGSGFTAPGLAVTLGGRPPAWLEVIDDNLLRLGLPPGSGPADLVLRTELGVASVPRAYTYQPAPRVDEVVPGRGRPGERIEIHGAHFDPDTVASLGNPGQGAFPLEDPEISPDLVAGRVPAVAGLVGLLLSSSRGSLSLARAFLALEPAEIPLVSWSAPATAPEQGGVPFVVLGERFPAAATVTVGGRELLDPWRISDRVLLGLLPPGRGAQPAAITAPGWSAALPEVRYEAGGPLQVDAVVPEVLPREPGGPVRILGKGFPPDSRVLLGGLDVIELQWSSSTELRGKDPGGPPGPVVVLLESSRGAVLRTDLLLRADPEDAEQEPELSRVEPGVGPAGGGFPLTILGSRLGQAVSATLGGAAIEELQAVGPDELRGRAPAGVPGPAELSVTLAGAQQPAPLAAAFAYVPDDTLLLVALEPADGPEGGGTQVVVHGSGFTPRTRLALGGAPLAEQRFVDQRTIVARTPPGRPGPAALTAAESGAEAVLPLAFHYRPAVEPRITGLSATEGPEQGGSELRVEGQGFDDATRAFLGGRALLELRVEGGQRLRGLTPPGSGQAVLRVETAGRTVEIPAAYGYLPAAVPRPLAAAVLPGQTSAAGGGLLLIRGAALDQVVEARLGEVTLLEPTLLDPFALVVRSPALPPGTDAELVLLDALGEAQRLLVPLAVLEPPRLLQLSPATGPEGGGTPLEVTFSGSPEGFAVQLGGLPLRGLEVEQGTARGLSPPGRGNVPILLENAVGRQTVPAAFSYRETPHVTGIDPPDGPAGGGSPVVVTGRSFTERTVITLGGLPLSEQRLIDPGRIEGLTAGGFGIVDAEAVDGDAANLRPRAFRYLPPLALQRWWPQVGSSAGGTLLVLEGDGFTHDLAVFVGGVRLAEAPADPATASFRFRSLLVPPGEAGTRAELRVEGRTGRVVLPGAFLYLPPSEPVLDLHGLAVRGLAARPGGGVWLATDQGLIRVAGASGEPELFRAADFILPDDDLRSVSAPAAGLVLAGSATGLAVCSDLPPGLVCRPVTALDLPEPPAGPLQLTALGLAKNGEALAAGPAGLLQVMLPGGAAARWVPGAALPGLGLPGSERRQMAADAAGELWVATDRGVARFDLAERRFVAYDAAGTGDALPSDEVLALASTPAGEVFAGTELGLARFVAAAAGPGQDAGSWEPVAGTEGRAVHALAAAGDGSLWAIADGELLQVRGLVAVPRADVVTGVADRPLLHLAASDDGCLWLATPAALWRLVP